MPPEPVPPGRTRPESVPTWRRAAASGVSCPAISGRRARPGPSRPPGDSRLERFVLALRADFGCLVIALAFVAIMISTIVFADIITPPASNPFV
jgi:hypothetical protein